MTMKQKLAMVNIVIALVAFPIASYLIYSVGGWTLLGGIFLFVWGNNISQKKD